MLDTASFVVCIKDGLKDRGFGHKRIKELTDDFASRMDAYKAQGKDTASAGTFAMKDLFDAMSMETAERIKRNSKMLSIQADNIARITQGVNAPVSKFLMDGKRGSKGTAIARAAVSLIEDDPRFAGLSYSANKESIRGQLYALFGATLDTVGKGFMGRQMGKAHLPNIAREISGVKTGDKNAAAVAKAWLKIQDLTVDLFNAAGGSMGRLSNYMPQGMNAVKMVQKGKAAWVKMHMDANTIDWNKTRWPDGKIIPANQRQAVLEKVFDTLSTDGAAKVDITAFRGRGRAIGNQLDTHRFLHYKDADAWLKVHDEYGDGNVFDVMTRHIEDMAHQIALVETFGPNPQMTALNVSAIVRKKAAEVGARELADAEAILKNKFQPMFETVMRENPMDPHSNTGAIVTGVANILTAAQLGSAALLAIPGDFMQTAAVRALNGMGMFNGVDTYFKTIATDAAFMRTIATQSGFVMDEAVMATYSSTRFTGIAAVGPTATRHVAEAVMRASLMSGHTKAARWSVQAEFMGMMHRARDLPFDKTPFFAVAQRYGITAQDWDAMRAVPSWQPRRDVNFLRPIDATKTANGQALYRKFQGMIYDEARKMVPEATIEGANTLKGTSRPDTLVGALLYSFAMYKNFPVSFMMIYGRLGMTSPTVKGRLAFYAGLGTGMTLVGALGTQMREISRGRDPLPMDNAAFIGKAFLSGGALSIWGDFLFAGVNEFGKGPEDVTAGPPISFLGDTTDLLLGDTFQFANTLGSLSDDEFKSTTLAKSVEWARRYTPGSSIWWARLALERQVFDRLQELADPKAYSKWRKRQSTQRKERGNEYWFAPGTDSPQRAPQIGG